MTLLGVTSFTWPADGSKNWLCLQASNPVTLLRIGSHPILTGARQLSRVCSFPGACMIWALSQLPLRSGGENETVWRDSWLPNELWHSLGLPHEDEPLLKEGAPVCLHACPVGSLWRAGMDVVRSLKPGSRTGARRRSLCILCSCSIQPSSWPPSMAL